jgi:hypothetical protein
MGVSFFIGTWKIMDGPMGIGITAMSRGTVWQAPL